MRTDITKYTALGFYFGLTRFEQMKLANHILGGWSFNREQYAHALGSTEITGAWLADLRRVLRTEGW